MNLHDVCLTVFSCSYVPFRAYSRAGGSLIRATSCQSYSADRVVLSHHRTRRVCPAFCSCHGSPLVAGCSGR